MADKVKIMFYTPSLNVGGIERVFITYANALCNRACVYFVYGHNGGDLLKLLKSDIVLCSLGDVRLRHSLSSMVGIINQYQPDYLVSGGDIPNAFCVFASFLSKKKPKTIISHHNYFNVESNRLVASVIIKIFYNRAYKVVSVSKGISSFLLKNGVSKNKLVTIYNPIDIQDLILKSQDICSYQIKGDYIVFVGRLNKVKNLFYMIDSFENVLRKYPSLKLLIIGEGDMRQSLEEYVSEKKLCKMVLFTGSVHNPYPYIVHAKLLLLPSFSEALPTVILEAFTLGITVVATPTNGAVDLLEDGYLGYLSESFTNAVAFSNAICKGIQMPISSKLLKQKASEYSIDSRLNELFTHFD